MCYRVRKEVNMDKKSCQQNNFCGISSHSSRACWRSSGIQKLRRMQPLQSCDVGDHQPRAAKSKAAPDLTKRRLDYDRLLNKGDENEDHNALSQETLILGEGFPGTPLDSETLHDSSECDETPFTKEIKALEKQDTSLVPDLVRSLERKRNEKEEQTKKLEEVTAAFSTVSFTTSGQDQKSTEVGIQPAQGPKPDPKSVEDPSAKDPETTQAPQQPPKDLKPPHVEEPSTVPAVPCPEGPAPSRIETSSTAVKKPKQTLEEKRAVARAASKRWHDKWVCKGVLKVQPEKQQSEKKEDKSQKQVSMNKNEKNEKKEKKEPVKNEDDKKDKENKVPDNGGQRKRKVPSTTAEENIPKENSKKPRKSKMPENIVKALQLDGMPSLNLLDTNDLRTTKAAFVKYYVEKLTAEENEMIKNESNPAPVLKTKGEKWTEGLEVWMNSALRGALMSGKGQGFAAIPASLLWTKR